MEIQKALEHFPDSWQDDNHWVDKSSETTRARLRFVMKVMENNPREYYVAIETKGDEMIMRIEYKRHSDIQRIPGSEVTGSRIDEVAESFIEDKFQHFRKMIQTIH